jgi:hypothetical protein
MFMLRLRYTTSGTTGAELPALLLLRPGQALRLSLEPFYSTIA